MLGKMRARLPRESEWPDPPRKGWPSGPAHDADTPTLELDQLLSTRHVPTPIRLFGTYAPEVSPLQTGGQESRQFANDWLLTVAAADSSAWPFWVQTYWVKSEEHEKFTIDRLLGMVTDRLETRCLNIEVSAFVDARGYPHGSGS